MCVYVGGGGVGLNFLKLCYTSFLLTYRTQWTQVYLQECTKKTRATTHTHTFLRLFTKNLLDFWRGRKEERRRRRKDFFPEVTSTLIYYTSEDVI